MTQLNGYLSDVVLVGNDSIDTVISEADSAVSEETSRLEHVADDEWLEDVKFEVSVGSSDTDSHLVTHDLGGDHSDGLALRRVHLSWHDRTSRLVLGEGELSESASRSGSKESDVVADFHEGDGDGVQSSVDLDEGVVGGKGLKLVRGGDKRKASEVSNSGGDFLGESLAGVKSGSDSGSSGGKLVEARKSRLDTGDRVVELLDVGGELLAEGERDGVLGVGTADLDDVLELFGLVVQGGAEFLEGWEQTGVDFTTDGDVHGGGEGVVGGLRHVHVVVRVDRLLRSKLSAKDFDGAEKIQNWIEFPARRACGITVRLTDSR